MSEDQSLLRHRQNIQRIQQRPPFLGVANNLQKLLEQPFSIKFRFLKFNFTRFDFK